jgi:hypothetical protein
VFPRADVGHHLGGSYEEGAERTCPADSRATGGDRHQGCSLMIAVAS